MYGVLYFCFLPRKIVQFTYKKITLKQQINFNLIVHTLLINIGIKWRLVLRTQKHSHNYPSCLVNSKMLSALFASSKIYQRLSNKRHDFIVSLFIGTPCNIFIKVYIYFPRRALDRVNYSLASHPSSLCQI